MVSAGRSTEETSLCTATTDPTEHLGADGHEEQSSISAGPDGGWDLWFHVWKPRFLQALGDSKPLGGHLDPHRGLEGKREWKAKGVIKIPFMDMVGGEVFPAAPRDTEIAPRDALGGLRMKRKRLKRKNQGN